MRSAFNLLLAAVCLSLIILACGKRDEAEVSTSAIAGAEGTEEFEPAVSRARVEGTEVLLVFGAKWCVWCQKFSRDILPNQRIASSLSARKATVVRVDVDKRRDISERYGVKTLPTMVLVDSEGRELRRMSGFATVKEFLGWVE